MQVVILAGGRGSRLGNVTDSIPKPMVEIGGIPILLHIMRIYFKFGYNEFIICLGYKGEKIKNYFKNFLDYNSDCVINTGTNEIHYLNKKQDKFKITLVNTGVDTGTGGRIKSIINYIESDNFFLTYGDGLGNINIRDLFKSHLKSKKLVTFTAVKPPGRFGTIEFNKNKFKSFKEKNHSSWINGGFFIINKKALKYINNKKEMWEEEPLKKLVNINQVNAFKHCGDWQCLDNSRDHILLEELWKRDPFWK